MLKISRIAAVALVFGLVAGCGEVKHDVQAVKARLGDPSAVVAATCMDASSPMCRCIAEKTVQTLQAGPRELVALFESPDAVWDDVVKSLSPAERDRTVRTKAAAEAACRRRIQGGPIQSAALGRTDRRAGAGRRPMQTIHGSCASEGNSRDACDCYEATLKNVLSDEAFNGLKTDASFPPPLETLPPKHRRTALATIASARSVCGLK